MRMLFTSSPGFGSFHPVVALAQAALALGHEVSFATCEERRSAVERMGMTFLPVGTNVADVRALVRSRYPDLQIPPVGPVDEQTRKRATSALFGDAYVESMLPGSLEAYKVWQPDVVVRAHLSYVGWIAAEACGVPHVTVEEFASGIPDWEQEALAPTLNAWRERCGLPTDPAASRLHHYLKVVPFPIALRHLTSPFGPEARRTRPLIFSESTDDVLPTWIDTLPDGAIVHASLGTVGNRPDLLSAMIESADGEPYSLILATGAFGDRAAFDPLPKNVRVARYIPHSLLLSRCDAIITHAGAGTLIASIGAGLPMVMVPLFGDQLPNAERAADAGAGIVLDQASLTPTSLRNATRAILSDPQYRRAVGALRDEMDGLPSHEQAIRWIAQVAETRAPLPAPG
jgi:UDP:flavonoid glycosyltransferase YjiC (YdhE family)